jgi:ABC-type multidrug transport system fused ATPase/permease subunit
MLRDPLNRTIDSMDMLVKTLLGLRRIEAFMRIANVEHYVTYVDSPIAVPAATSPSSASLSQPSSTDQVYTSSGIGAQIINGTFEWDALDDEAAQDEADAERERIIARLASSDGSRRTTGIHYREERSGDEDDDNNSDIGMRNKRGLSSRAAGTTSPQPNDASDSSKSKLLTKNKGSGNDGYGTISASVPRRARRNSNNSILQNFTSSPRGSPLGSRSNSFSTKDALPPVPAQPIRHTLEDININFPAGRLTICVGSVGSGKSSLIHSLLAEMHCIKGSVTVPRKLTFCPQAAWMLNDSIRGNVCFGLPYNQAKFERAIKACSLLPDLAQFENGDMTEIGEHGLNLSGGQKQRLGLARAVYADADLVYITNFISPAILVPIIILSGTLI